MKRYASFHTTKNISIREWILQTSWESSNLRLLRFHLYVKMLFETSTIDFI